MLGGEEELSKVAQMEFGKSMRERFSYLIISGMFITFTVIILKMMLPLMGADEEFLATYDLFYSLVGAGLGFLLAQIFIRSHTKAVRLGRI